MTDIVEQLRLGVATLEDIADEITQLRDRLERKTNDCRILLDESCEQKDEIKRLRADVGRLLLACSTAFTCGWPPHDVGRAAAWRAGYETFQSIRTNQRPAQSP